MSQLSIVPESATGNVPEFEQTANRYTVVEASGDSAGETAEQSAAIASSKPKKQKAGMMEGLWLFWKYDYVKGIFAVSCLFMVEVTILDYTMKILGAERRPARGID